MPLPPRPLPDRSDFGRLFAELFREKAEAEGVIIDARGNIGNLRPFDAMSPRDWWCYIHDRADRFPDGLRGLLRVAADLCPGSQELRPWRTAPQRTDSTDRGANLVLTLQGSHTLDEVAAIVETMRGLERQINRPVTFNFGTTGSENLHFFIKDATDQDVDRFIERARSLLAESRLEGTVQREPYNFRDYYADPITVEGPDGQRFALEQIRASTVVGDVARTVMNDYASSIGPAAAAQGGRQQAVVDLMGTDGSTLRLDPRLTLHDAGVRPGAVLRVHPERTAGAVNPLIREEALARVRMQVQDYAATHPGFTVTANSPVAPTEFVFSFDIPGFAPPAQPGAPPRPIARHEVLVFLPADFPLQAPEAWWQSDIFHPNIDRKTGWVCLGPLQTYYKPGLDFGELCQMLVDIAGYRLYSAEPGNFLDAEASLWAHSPAGQRAIEAAGGFSILGRLVFEGRPERILRRRPL